MGTANTVVEEEDNREETENKNGGMSTREHLLQMLSISDTSVGHVNKTGDLATQAEGCWNGDTLADLCVTDI